MMRDIETEVIRNSERQVRGLCLYIYAFHNGNNQDRPAPRPPALSFPLKAPSTDGLVTRTLPRSANATVTVRAQHVSHLHWHDWVANRLPETEYTPNTTRQYQTTIEVFLGDWQTTCDGHVQYQSLRTIFFPKSRCLVEPMARHMRLQGWARTGK